MTPELTTPQVAQEQLDDLNRTLEKEKVDVTPEVEEYTRSHVRAVQDKLQAGEDVYESDLAFIEKVKLWVMIPKEWREKYPNIEEMSKNNEIMNGPYEANKRHISLQQWVDLLHIARSIVGEREWIDTMFQFPGGGKIRAEKDLRLPGRVMITRLPEGLSVKWSLRLEGCTRLTKLPEGLEVGEDLNLQGCIGLTELPEGLTVGGNLNLEGCTGLTELPEGLKVGMSLHLIGCTGLTKLPEGLKLGSSLYLSGCTGLTKLPEKLKVSMNLNLYGCTGLTELPEELKVGGDLILRGCTGLTELPEGLKAGENLHLNGCTGLTKLPEGLTVGGNLYLSTDLNEQVKKDAERLKREGKIRLEIEWD